MKKVFFICLALVFFFLNLTGAQAIVWCHDYTYFRVTGTDPSPPVNENGFGIGADTLRNYLETNGFKKFPYTNAVELPNAGQRLKAGDVIIIDSAHSGYVTGPDSIDHFIQVAGSVGKMYKADELPAAGSDKVGGLFIGDTLTEFMNRRFSKQYSSIEVWRKS